MKKNEKLSLTGLVSSVNQATAVRNGVSTLVEGVINELNDLAGFADDETGARAKELASELGAQQAALVDAISGMNTYVDGVSVEGETSRKAKADAKAAADKAGK